MKQNLLLEEKINDWLCCKKGKTKKDLKLNPEIQQFMQDQNKKWEEQSKVNQVVLTSIQEILLRLGRIEKCPTIKKELDELE